MTEKRISAEEFIERMKALRKRSPDPNLVDRFNKLVEQDEKHDEKHERDRAERERRKKVARDPEADL